MRCSIPIEKRGPVNRCLVRTATCRRNVPHFFVFVSFLFGIESQKCWPNEVLELWYCRSFVPFYHPQGTSSSSPVFVFILFLKKGMFALLVTRVNGARYRSPEGSAHVFLHTFFCGLFFPSPTIINSLRS